MLTDRDRLRRRASQPRLVALHRALGRLRSPLTVMNTGAHPDDEHNGMLSVMRHQMGMRIVVACSTRGEGGQNTLGRERGGVLGVLRSREMEEAARAMDADVAWLGHGPDDPVHDFGFSKSGPDTLSRWGEELTVDRLVRAYRQFRPDIVMPTFLDVPGQHGHHRAMTQAAERALVLAADPAYQTDNLAPWRVAKFYLPAWSGGGDTYDDEVPPPPATTQVVADGGDPVTGMSYDRLGEVSRAFHASQNMGFWRLPAQTRWDLHLVGGTAETGIADGLPTRLADLAPLPVLVAADAAIDQALRQFPDGAAILRALSDLRRHLGSALAGLEAEARARHGHRIERKLAETDLAMALAAGIEVTASPSSASVAPGGTVDIAVELAAGSATDLRARILASDAFAPVADQKLNDGVTSLTLSAREDAPIANPFRPDWLSLGGNGDVSLVIDAIIGSDTIRFALDLEEDLQLAPAYRLSIQPESILLPLPATGSRSVAIKSDLANGRITAPAPHGLTTALAGNQLTITPAASLAAGRHTLPLLVDGKQAHDITPIAYPHIGHTRHARPLTLDVLALDLVLPQGRVGYVSGGADRVGLWLNRMGVDVTELDAEALAGNLTAFDTIVIGIFSFGTRPDLAAATRRLHDWVASGGHLVTLYHRPSDGWNPAATPPLPLTIGSPSLRWRVTNPAAPVTILAADHPLLTGPNRIEADDFAGWDKERGLYFASAWDEAYRPLLSLSDAGEKPLNGSLLSAEIGKGRHTHTSLVLHHQMDRLVPGAFRLMANLLQPA
jgi:LmbE family N-acetylglucosaminyl deacetylase